jgi:hypothetical protein
MNKRTTALALRFAMSRLTGDAAWTVAGAYGNALAWLELGDERQAAWNYAQGKRYLREMLRRGCYMPINTNSAAAQGGPR